MTSSSFSSSSSSIDSTLNLLLTEQPLSDALPFYRYGTAGFRFEASCMDGLMVRVGLLSIVLLLESGENMGIMITASHNDERYNGVKLSNPDGSMSTPSQEEFLTQWVNETDKNRWKTFLQEQQGKHMNQNKNETQILHFGRDTRVHSPHLAHLCQQGAQAMIQTIVGVSSSTTTITTPASRVVIQDHGIVTTPMLHHVVLHSNPQYLPLYIQPKPSRQGYVETFCLAYVDLVLQAASTTSTGTTNSSTYQLALPNRRLHVDGACGVGYQAVQEMSQTIQDWVSRMHEQEEQDGNNSSSTHPTHETKAKIPVNNIMTLFLAHNGPGDGPLNVQCGSDHVQTQLRPPIWYDGTPTSSLEYCCAVDGDADRIVFFGQTVHPETSTTTTTRTCEKVTTNTNDDQDETERPEGSLTQLLDGDKIAILIAHVLKAKLEQVASSSSHDKTLIPKMGIVQTAYANGASTRYVQSTLNVPVLIAKTGVKHLHHAAVTNFDIGIYFEANGHGTVVFSKLYEEFAIQQRDKYQNPFFVQIHQLINPAVGDALCDMLLVDYLLQHELGGWTLPQWNGTWYTDLPSRMLKVQVSDRSIIQCNDNETLCWSPSTVQPLLDQAMKAVPFGRTFVRPSGTEDIVRVYAEAETREQADALALQVVQIVYDTCHGVGDRPTSI